MVKNNFPPLVLFWFRRDLRLFDNAGLYHALKENKNVLCLFIFDKDILDGLEHSDDARVNFIHSELCLLQGKLRKYGSDLLVQYGKPAEIFRSLLQLHPVEAVYANEDYEPYAILRDTAVSKLCTAQGVPFRSFKDQVIFAKSEVMAGGGKPYKVYTPYKNKWLETLNDFYLKSYPVKKYTGNLVKVSVPDVPTLQEMGFRPSSIRIPGSDLIESQIKTYDQTRNFPKNNSTSRLGVHLRFGTVSVREIARMGKTLNDVWLSELIWREFFMQLLFHFPYVVDKPFNEKFTHFVWRHDEGDFQQWCAGMTGYPMVDAGMRELNATGFMHNRARLVVASFLTKHLLIDWKWGEAYFAQRLLDYDLASNNGNWQWSAGTGADAQPFFRIFNPTLQQERFDPEFDYIKNWVPEYGTKAYPKPMVEHKEAVERAKKAFGNLSRRD